MIFVIRTRGNPFKSRPHPYLTMTSLAIVLFGALMPFTPIGSYFGFVAPPATFYAILGGMALAYLVVVQGVKTHFYRHYEVRH